MRRFEALSSTTRTRKPSSAVVLSTRGSRSAAAARSKVAVKKNVLPSSDFAVDPHAAVHQLDEPERDRETEPGAAEPPGCRGIGLREA